MDQGIELEPIGRGYKILVSLHHTFGTDAVLLADFAAARYTDRMADLGTGCGIIPFLMLRDGLLNSAVGIDISPEAVSLAEKTAAECGFGKFTAVCSNITKLKDKLQLGSFTLVTCNPPYKAAGAGLKNPDAVICTARHETECTLSDIISTAARLLQTGGRLCMCHRPERLAELMALMTEYKAEPKRLRLVCQRRGQEPWLVLVEGRRCGRSGLRIEPTLYVEDEKGNYSKEMLEIYGPYKEGYV